MSIRCRDLMKIPSLKDMKLIAGEAGLDKIIRWVYIGEAMINIEDTIDWIIGNELVIITGSSFNGDIQKIVNLIPKYNEKKVAGIIINIGNYIPSIPPELINIADKLRLPLFELPWEVRLVNITRDIGSAIITKEIEEDTKNHLLESILFGDIKLHKNIINLFERFGFELNEPFVIGVLDIDCFNQYIISKKIKSESEINNIKSSLIGALNDSFSIRDIKVLAMLRSDSVIFLIKSNPYINQTLEAILEEIWAYMSQRFPGIKLHAGIGKSYTDIDLFRDSYQQAEQALKAAKCQHSSSMMYCYEDIGIYSLLMNITNRHILEEYFQSTLGRLIEYDKDSNSNLYKTLETYLNNNCKISSTSKILFIHENTLKYRLEKIESLIDCDLRDLQQLIKLEMGLKVGQLLHTQYENNINPGY
jgi:PucR family transcriptional regulator, proline-responsive transcriptional activator